MSLTQLQAPVENFLWVVLPSNKYLRVTSGYKLSNALTLVIIRQLQRSQTFFVKKVKSTAKKKRPPLILFGSAMVMENEIKKKK